MTHKTQSTALVPSPAIERRFRVDVREQLEVITYMVRTSPEFASSDIFRNEKVRKLTGLCDDFDQAWAEHFERQKVLEALREAHSEALAETHKIEMNGELR